MMTILSVAIIVYFAINIGLAVIAVIGACLSKEFKAFFGEKTLWAVSIGVVICLLFGGPYCAAFFAMNKNNELINELIKKNN